MSRRSSRITDWKPARKFPETYPGDCPDHSYLIFDTDVYPIEFAEPGELESATVAFGPDRVSLNSILQNRGLPSLGDRFASIAYGANRNPATLAIKMENYSYEGLSDGLVLPVLKGVTRGRDVVACGVSGQGYLYADLIPAEDGAPEATIESWLPLLDDDQLRVMHDGENVRGGLYSLAALPFQLDGTNDWFPALAYAGNDAAFVSPTYGQPLAYTSVQATDRELPTMSPTEMMEHLLSVDGLGSRIAELLRVETDDTPAKFLMAFMNKHWWERFSNGTTDERYERVCEELQAVIEDHQPARSTADVLRARRQTFTVEDAYDPQSLRRLRESRCAN